MKNIMRTATILIALILAPLAWSMDLDEAKTKGLVGETAKGYLALVDSSVTSEVKSLVKDVNDKRKEKYKTIAAKNKITLEAVEARAGEVAIKKTPSGQFVKRSGKWVKKP